MAEPGNDWATVREAPVRQYRDKLGGASFFALDELPEFASLEHAKPLAIGRALVANLRDARTALAAALREQEEA